MVKKSSSHHDVVFGIGGTVDCKRNIKKGSNCNVGAVRFRFFSNVLQ